jgi:hypothetical protein
LRAVPLTSRAVLAFYFIELIVDAATHLMREDQATLCVCDLI